MLLLPCEDSVIQDSHVSIFEGKYIGHFERVARTVEAYLPQLLEKENIGVNAIIKLNVRANM